ncbi:MAG: glycosyltransferase [Oscillochloridaceae bacterium umkhey_bin13]
MTFVVVILSARASNLVPCVQALLAAEPTLAPERIVVVDDGARAEAAPHLPPIRWVDGVKPFVFARNANLGIATAGEADVILLNDDARLITPGGFGAMAAAITATPTVGVCSAAVQGAVGNRRQHPAGTAGMRIEATTLAFVCVYLPRRVWHALGPFDERFTGYGYEDNDYCERARAAGWQLGIFDGCIVEHGSLPSTFRTRPDILNLLAHNRRLFAAKERQEPPMETRPTASNNMPPQAAQRWLQICFCDTAPKPGYEPARLLPFPGSGDLDLRTTWPWADHSFACIHAHELLEHLPDPLHTMNELWRVLAPGGSVEVAVPTTDGTGAFQDPTHVLFWNRASFRYFTAGTPERASLARRVTLHAAFAITAEQLEQTIDGPRLTITLRALKDAIPAALPLANADPSRPVPPMADPLPAPTLIMPDPGTSRFLGALRIKNEAAYIGEVLERALALCGRVVVFDDHSTDATPMICQQFGSRVALIGSPFQGLDESRDKNYLLQQIIALAPEWVLWIDGDEGLERSGAERIRRAIRENPRAALFALRVAYLWDRPDQERVDGIWGRFFRPSLFRLQGQRVHHLRFVNTGQGANFHCGNVPQGLRGPLRHLEVRLKHYGYLERERRQAKYHWYNQIDPHNEGEDCYRHLAEIPGARYAPGPPRLVPWHE